MSFRQWVSQAGPELSNNVEVHRPETAWTVTLLDRRSALPPNDLVSAVFLLAMKDDLIVAVRNERGWDIPGGHVEAGETPRGSCGNVRVGRAICYRQRACSFAGHVVLRNECFRAVSIVGKWRRSEKRASEYEEFVTRYYGPVEVIRALVEGARARLRRAAENRAPRPSISTLIERRCS